MAIYDNRVCQSCGITFSGGPRAWYCPSCRDERRREQNREHKRKGSQRKLGSTDICQNCGGEYVVDSGLQKYCPKCQSEMHKKIDNVQSTKYYHEKVDKQERKIKRRIYYNKNRTKLLIKRRQYDNQNKEQLNARGKEYLDANPEQRKFFNEAHCIKQKLKRSKWKAKPPQS